jgi:rhodanese-related sulfurtransferase
VAQILEENGFDEVHPLIGGFDDYKEANLPVEPK